MDRMQGRFERARQLAAESDLAGLYVTAGPNFRWLTDIDAGGAAGGGGGTREKGACRGSHVVTMVTLVVRSRSLRFGRV